MALLDSNKIPVHVAIIMDGNGRWARKRGCPREEGHRKGSEVIEPLLDASLQLGIKVVSLYAFSTENWKRSPKEILSLWNILDDFFTAKLGEIKKKGIKIHHSGELRRLPFKTKKIITQSIKETETNNKIVLNFCLNYGGQQEIVRAVNSWLKIKKSKEKLTEKKIERNLDTFGLPKVDLLIRTSGEQRISNFMLWQLAYAELVFLDVLWPDFKKEHLYEAVSSYKQRQRRFGGR